jgi:hypothetical protein
MGLLDIEKEFGYFQIWLFPEKRLRFSLGSCSSGSLSLDSSSFGSFSFCLFPEKLFRFSIQFPLSITINS